MIPVIKVWNLDSDTDGQLFAGAAGPGRQRIFSSF